MVVEIDFPATLQVDTPEANPVFYAETCSGKGFKGMVEPIRSVKRRIIINARTDFVNIRF